MLFSIIIVNYKTPELTRNCLDSLLKLPAPEEREIIIVDNASGDGSSDQLRRLATNRFRLIESQENRGFGAANNLGAKEASGRYLLFLNSDTIVTDNILQEAAKIFAANGKIGLISPRLEDEGGKIQADVSGSFPTLSRTIIKKFGKDNGYLKQDGLKTVDWVSGCALFIRHDLFNRLGGFDERFFLYFEDVDLCRRAQALGFETVLADYLRLTHLGGRSLKQNATRKRHYYHSQDIYFKKHRPTLEGCLLKIARFPLKLIKSLAV